MLRINPSDAFSVLLTFSPSPKRHVVCQRAFIKLDQRENNVKTPGSPQRRADRLSQRRCLLLSSTGAAAHSFLSEEHPSPPSLPSAWDGEGGGGVGVCISGQKCTNVAHYSKATYAIQWLLVSGIGRRVVGH